MQETPPGSPAIRLDRTARTPLWRQLAEDLRRRLDQGQFADAFPGEVDLGLLYGVSRHTVREALRQLRAEGVITTGRGRRSRLAGSDPVIAQPTGIAYSLFSSVESCGLAQTSVVRKLDLRADGVIAPRLGLEESTPLLYLERLRLADGRPLAIDRVWIPGSIGEPLLDVDFRRTSLYAELARTGIPVTGGEETVRAVVPSKAEHDLLGLRPPSAVFSVERAGTCADVAIEWRHTLIRADRFALTSRLSSGARAPQHRADDISAARLTPSFG